MLEFMAKLLESERAPRVVILTKQAAEGEAIARTMHDARRKGWEIMLTQSRIRAMGWIRDAADRRVILVAALDLEVPNQGLEALLHARRARADARLVLLAPAPRFAAGVDGMEVVSTTTGTVPTIQVDPVKSIAPAAGAGWSARPAPLAGATTPATTTAG